jgi:hypothetical protein
MKQDMDLIRTLLLRIESDPQFDGNRKVRPDPGDLGITDHSSEEVARTPGGYPAPHALFELVWADREMLCPSSGTLLRK